MLSSSDTRHMSLTSPAAFPPALPPCSSQGRWSARPRSTRWGHWPALLPDAAGDAHHLKVTQPTACASPRQGKACQVLAIRPSMQNSSTAKPVRYTQLPMIEAAVAVDCHLPCTCVTQTALKVSRQRLHWFCWRYLPKKTRAPRGCGVHVMLDVNNKLLLCT
jgi:hypothetical protein